MSCPTDTIAAGTTGLEYAVNYLDGESYYVSDYNGTATNVEVPATYNGQPVVGIGEYAFRGSEIEDVTLPDSIRWIKDSAFEACENLKSIDLGDGLQNIKSMAFYGCIALQRVEFPATLSSIGAYAFSCCSSVEEYVVNSENQYFSTENGVLFSKSKNRLYKYPSKASAKTYVVPATVNNVEQFAFSDCMYLEEVTFSCNPYNNMFYTCPSLRKVNFAEGATSVGDIFYDCPNVEAISLSKTVTSVSIYVLSKLPKLSSVTIDANNSTYSVENNVIFNKGKTELLFYLPGKEGTSYTVPSTVEAINVSAFLGAGKLESVVISENVSSISDDYYDEPMLNLSRSNVKSISVVGGNQHFSSVDGVLFNKDKTALLCYPRKKAGSSYKVPDGTKTIRKYAIYDCTDLKKVSVPASVTAIGDCGLGYRSGDKVISSFTIEGKSGSVAAQYATSCGITFVDTSHTHKYTSRVTTAATVNKRGVRTYTCTCGHSYTKTIAQLKCSKPKLKGIENTSDGVKITWGKVSGADKYEVYRKVKGGSYSKIGTTAKTYYADKKAKSGKDYYYTVKAINEAGKSDSSSAKSIKHLADPTLKTPKSVKKGITLKWGKVTGAQGYVIYYKTGSGSYKKLATVKGSSKVSYTHTKAKKGKKYTYKVKAYYSKTYSAYSNTKTIKDKY